ncbi:hypothetical protein OS242_10615 [Tumebacillus sp. DT12]|uniref:Uncharacterized protein n=1 Tax=Tumebacillus lacus TaxID=2995335 RepID=A0ABT3X4A7_9BACL|nr:hypothetical protein [Tumebacillus lacus]MCX7570415.1 hypothetical protein [Tumebacillus lacus]
MLDYNKWQAQLMDNTKMYGGTGGEYDVNADTVPVDQIKCFSVSDTLKPSIAVYNIGGQERWYQGGVTYRPTFPLEFQLKDGSVLTITRASDKSMDLRFTQN